MLSSWDRENSDYTYLGPMKELKQVPANWKWIPLNAFSDLIWPAY